MKNERGFVNAGILIAIVIGLIFVGGGAYYVMQQNSPSPSVTDATGGALTSISGQLLTFVDADGRFSLEYPSDLIPQVSKDSAFQIDSVSFKNGTATAFTMNVRRHNARWPDLQSYLNDQILSSKGGIDSPEKKITPPSGIEFIDVGSRHPFGHIYFAQLSPSEYIEFSFYDESYIEQVLPLIIFSKTSVDDPVSNIPQGWGGVQKS